MQNFINWDKIVSSQISGIEFPICDRNFVLAEIAQRFPKEKIYFWNQGYRYLQEFQQNRLEAVLDYCVSENAEVLELAHSLDEGILIVEGMGQIESNEILAYQLENLYFDPQRKTRLILADHLITIPDSLYSIIPKIKVKLPNILEIKSFISEDTTEHSNESCSQYVGLSYGEISLLNQKKMSTEDILAYKTAKLASKGLQITPTPDVESIGGLDLLMRDLNKIRKLFHPSAYERGLRPPKGCLLWGLPGTGKSLTAKMLSKILKVPLISCNWNQLVSSSLSESLQNIDLVFQLVDSIGSCVIFFDEFEKAFFGWNSGDAGGVMAKMAGYLLSWMQDHTSPSIMVATINRLDMLPPELIRRFEYVWFFDINLHNGGMYEVLKVHLNLHFPGFHEQFEDDNWYRIFSEYRSCSPAELAGAVRRVHDEIFYLDLHNELTVEILIEYLVRERRNFRPGVSDPKISDALAVIRRTADFARPVQGKDRSRFASPPIKLFQQKKSLLPEDYTCAI
ncbi:MAG: AAA family ATPase [Cyanobacteria bacterium J06600_6]